ncbi:MAG: outer membrane beta-barrel protein [Bacteroidota bacterium]
MKSFLNIIQTGILTILLLAALSNYEASAQNHIQLTYDYSIATGETADYIATSFRGGSFEFGHHLTDRIAIGLKVGLHTFYDELDKDTYSDDNVTVYGKQFRYMNSFPALATFQYNFMGQESRVLPYGKLGVGAYYFQRRTDLGLYTFTNNYNWSFGLQPEAGVLIPITRNIRVNIGARYNYVFKNQELDNQGYVNINLGLMFYNLGREQMQ